MEEKVINGKRCCIYENNNAEVCLIQPVDTHDLELLDKEVELIEELAPQTPFTLTALLIEDWNTELSPWNAPAVFGTEDFGCGAAKTLSFITDKLIPIFDTKKHYYLGGYSLAGLFALWSAYQTDIFDGIAAVSPSVWFPNWESYAQTHTIKTHKVYLSLGDREEKTRNKIMSAVGNCIRRQHDLLLTSKTVSTLEWNSGNHFTDTDFRTAKGFAWLLNET